MAESVDDEPAADVPFENLPPAQNGHTPVTAIPAAADNGPEFALVSAIMGDPGGLSRACIGEIPIEAFTAPETRAIWTVWRSGVDPDDLIALSDQAKVPIVRLLQIAELDRAGATFSAARRVLAGRMRLGEIRRLAASLAEHPDNCDVLAPRIAALAESDSQIALLPGRQIGDFAYVPRTDRSCLLGNRYLNRGDGLVIASNSGMGKSSLTLQAAVLWALGRPFAGIAPNGPLRSLVFQAEDSEGDIAEVWLSILHCLKLTDEERAQVSHNVCIVTDRQHAGESFVRELRGQARIHRPDMVWINPLAAFAGGDISDAREAGIFLRQQLNGANPNCEWAYAVVTHTTKPATGKDRLDRKWNEQQYNLAGSYDLVGWARAMISLEATPDRGEFNLVLAKRGTRADVRVAVPNDKGFDKWEFVTSIPLKHATGFFKGPGMDKEIPLVFWEDRPVAPSEAKQGGAGRPKKHLFEDFMPIWPKNAATARGLRVLHKEAKDIRLIGNGPFESLIRDAVLDGFLIKDSSFPKLPKYYLNSGPKI